MTTQLNEEAYVKKSVAQLAEEIAQNLEGEKFFLVMDDLWKPRD